MTDRVENSWQYILWKVPEWVLTDLSFALIKYIIVFDFPFGSGIRRVRYLSLELTGNQHKTRYPILIRTFGFMKMLNFCLFIFTAVNFQMLWLVLLWLPRWRFMLCMHFLDVAVIVAVVTVAVCLCCCCCFIVVVASFFSFYFYYHWSCFCCFFSFLLLLLVIFLFCY